MQAAVVATAWGLQAPVTRGSGRVAVSQHPHKARLSEVSERPREGTRRPGLPREPKRAVLREPALPESAQPASCPRRTPFGSAPPGASSNQIPAGTARPWTCPRHGHPPRLRSFAFNSPSWKPLCESLSARSSRPAKLLTSVSGTDPPVSAGSASVRPGRKEGVGEVGSLSVPGLPRLRSRGSEG